MTHKRTRQNPHVKKFGKHKQSSLWKFRVKEYREDKHNFYNAEKVPPQVAEKLMTGYPNVNPEERHNDSPKMKDMVMLAKKYRGSLEGYVVPVESGRPDARITFDGIVLPVSMSTARKLADTFALSKPDEIDKVEGGIRIWWD